MTTKLKEDLTGRRQHKIKVVERVPRPEWLTQVGSYWRYRCDCGQVKTAHRTTIVRGLKSCGCQRKVKKYDAPSTPHYRRLYHVWRQVMQRCKNPNNPDHKNYGARGIEVSSDWTDFGRFLTDMLPTYRPGLTLERVDVDGNYCKENCTWITNEAQASNRRSSLSYRRLRGLP